MVKVYAISTAVVADAIRRKVLWIVVVFSAILALAIPSLPSYGVGVVGCGVPRGLHRADVRRPHSCMALALSVTRIPLEVERRTVFNVISRDVRRWQYVFATWLGMFAVLGVMLLVVHARHHRHRGAATTGVRCGGCSRRRSRSGSRSAS